MGAAFRYAGWMARDVARAQLLRAWVVAGLLIGLALLINGDGMGEERARRMASSLVTNLDWLVITLAVAGIVATDRTQGYQRLYFARPVRPAAFYLLKWLIAGAGVLLLPLIVTGAVYARTGVLALDAGVVAELALMYLMLGGLVFLLSTITRLDAIVAVAVLVTQVSLAEAMKRDAVTNPIIRAVAHALPPFSALTPAGLPLAGPLLHVVVYGVALVAGALAVVSLAPMSRGSRD